LKNEMLASMCIPFLKMPMSFLTLYKGNLQIHYETMNKSSWRSNKPLYVVRPWGRALVKLRWPKALPTMLKPPTRFIIIFGRMLIESKNLQGILFSEMPHVILSLWYLVGINEIYKQATHCVMTKPYGSRIVNSSLYGECKVKPKTFNSGLKIFI